MPIDPKGYHYFLVVVEISRRRVDAEPIKNKTANSVLKAFIKIYGRSRIQPPIHRLETDSGSEFTNSQICDFFLNSIGVMMRFGKPGRHKQQSYAERAIQAIQEPLLKRMTAQELKTELLLEGTLVQIKLLEPISVLGKKVHGKFRTGDIKWDPKVCIIKKLILSPEQPPTYLLDGPHGRLGVSRCAYTRKELQVIPINEKSPPDSVIRGQPERYVPEKILNHRTKKGQLQYLVKWERYSEDESTWESADKLQEDVPNLVYIYNNTK
ncbi:chromobox protein homolog 5-like [Rhizophagus clarus]|uniref:Chromobox protein homolog 5-like n=1 Tax=Rhizophagus clarus TaxID=94130 RepID=A0A8H3L0Q0_9GLOM|nr:chromobox protein homolog 5-like [Rhizophagus clarus]